MQTCSKSMGHHGSRDLHRREKALARKCDPEHSHRRRHHHDSFASNLELAITTFPEVTFVRSIPNGRLVSDSLDALTTCDSYSDHSVCATSFIRLVAIIRVKNVDITCIYDHPRENF